MYDTNPLMIKSDQGLYTAVVVVVVVVVNSKNLNYFIVHLHDYF